MIPAASIELLETRIAPAGVVGVVFDQTTGALLVAGDAERNSFTIYQSGPNSVRVEGSDSETSVGNPGQPFVDVFGKVKTLTVGGGGGAFDAITVRNVLGLESFTLESSGGDETVEVRNLATKGDAVFNMGSGSIVQVNGLTAKIGGDLIVNHDGGGVFFLQAETSAIKGAALITGGPDEELTFLEGEKLTIGKGIAYDSLAGGGSLTVEAASAVIGSGPGIGSLTVRSGADGGGLTVGGSALFQGPVTYAGGAGAGSFEKITVAGDSVTFGSTLVVGLQSGGGYFDAQPDQLRCKGAVSLDLGSDGGEFTLQGRSVAFSKTLDIVSGNDGGATVALSAPVATYLGAVTASFGAGDDSFVMGAAARATLSKSLTVAGAGGTDSFELNGVTTVKGAVTFDGGDGGGTFAFGGSAQTISGDVTVRGGAGRNETTVNSESFTVGGTFIYAGGSGYDGFFLYGVRTNLKKGFDFTGGMGLSAANLETRSLTVGGPISMTGTDNLSASIFAEALKLAKGVTVTAGTGVVHVFGDGTIAGDVGVSIGSPSADVQEVRLHGLGSSFPGGLKLGGNLTVTATGMMNDSFQMSDVTIAKNTTVRLGSGATTVTLDNVTARGSFALDTGDGADNVEIERWRGFGASQFLKLATIQLGAGADSLRLGVSATAGNGASTAIFRGGGSVDGGEDYDDSNDFLLPAVNTPGTLTRVGFEAMTLT